MATYTNDGQIVIKDGDGNKHIVNPLTRDENVSLDATLAAALGLTGNPQVKDALEKIKTLIDGNTTLANSKAQIETGSYTGTGTYGESNPNSYAISTDTKLLLIQQRASSGFAVIPIWALDATFRRTVFSAGPSALTSLEFYVKKDGNVVSWYASSTSEQAERQLNKSGNTYYVTEIR